MLLSVLVGEVQSEGVIEHIGIRVKTRVMVKAGVWVRSLERK